MANTISRVAIRVEPLMGSESFNRTSEIAGPNTSFTFPNEKAGGGGSNSSAEVESEDMTGDTLCKGHFAVEEAM
jgi:hypothetical protein